MKQGSFQDSNTAHSTKSRCDATYVPKKRRVNGATACQDTLPRYRHQKYVDCNDQKARQGGRISAFKVASDRGSRKVTSIGPNDLKSLGKKDWNSGPKLVTPRETGEIGHVARVEKKFALRGALADGLIESDFKNGELVSPYGKALKSLGWCGSSAHPVHLGGYSDEHGGFSTVGFHKCNNIHCPTCARSSSMARLDETIEACTTWKDMGENNEILAVTLTVPRDPSVSIARSFADQVPLFFEAMKLMNKREKHTLKESVGLETFNMNAEPTFGRTGVHVHAHCAWFVKDKDYHQKTDLALSMAVWEVWNRCVEKAAKKLGIAWAIEKMKKGPLVKKPESYKDYKTYNGKRYAVQRIKGGVVVEKSEKFDAKSWAEYLQKSNREEKSFHDLMNESIKALAYENVFYAEKSSERYTSIDRAKRYTISDLLDLLRHEEKIIPELSGDDLDLFKEEVRFAKQVLSLSVRNFSGHKFYRWGYITVEGKKRPVSAKKVLISEKPKTKIDFMFEKSSDLITEKGFAEAKEAEITSKEKKGCGLDLSPLGSDKLEELYRTMAYMRARKLAIRKDLKKREESRDFLYKIKSKLVKWANCNPNLFAFNVSYKSRQEMIDLGNRIYKMLQESRVNSGDLYNEYLDTFKGVDSLDRKEDYLCTTSELLEKVNVIRAKEKELSRESKLRVHDPLDILEAKDQARGKELKEEVEKAGAYSVKLEKNENGYILRFRHHGKLYSVQVEHDCYTMILEWGPPIIGLNFAETIKIVKYLERQVWGYSPRNGKATKPQFEAF